MRILIFVMFAQGAIASSCPSTAVEAFQRFEQIQSVNAAAHALSGQLLFQVQPIENAPGANGESIPNDRALKYTVSVDMLPGKTSVGKILPIENSPKPEPSTVYGIEKMIEEGQNFGKLLAKSGVTPTSVSSTFKPQSYLSNAMFHVTAKNSSSQVLERGGAKHRVFHYELKPKPKYVLLREREKRQPAQLSGEMWLSAETCTPILLIGKLEDTMWAVVDRFELEFGTVDLGFYPTRIFIRTFVSGTGRVASWFTSLGGQLGGGSYRSTELSIGYIGQPNFRPIHNSLLNQIR